MVKDSRIFNFVNEYIFYSENKMSGSMKDKLLYNEDKNDALNKSKFVFNY